MFEPVADGSCDGVVMDGEKKGWKDLNVGAERRVTYGHTQVLVINRLQRN